MCKVIKTENIAGCKFPTNFCQLKSNRQSWGIFCQEKIGKVSRKTFRIQFFFTSFFKQKQSCQLSFKKAHFWFQLIEIHFRWKSLPTHSSSKCSSPKSLSYSSSTSTESSRVLARYREPRAVALSNRIFLFFKINLYRSWLGVGSHTSCSFRGAVTRRSPRSSWKPNQSLHAVIRNELKMKIP